MTLGRHLSNIADHRRPRAQMLHRYTYRAAFDPRARELEWRLHLDWIRRNVIGPPKATDACTVAQLEEMGMIGIYAPPNDSHRSRIETTITIDP